ncbi:MAG TPA: CAP domain-containing protein [Roseiflexaceae bacterium]|nr:CAP domain-containing protein [Roseiflexaceae bacterium]
MPIAPLRLPLLLLLLMPALAVQPAARAEVPSGLVPEIPGTMRPQTYLPLVGYVTSGGAGLTPAEQRVVDLTNNMRAAAGCLPLEVSPQLTAIARAHSQDMAAHGFLDHVGSDGSSPFERMERVGYTFSRAAENIAAGYATAESVMAGWEQSAGHRTNILNCALTEVGVGYAFDAESAYSHYWTQDFGTP